MNPDVDDYEREERIAIIAEGCRISQVEAEEIVKQIGAALEDKSNRPA